MTKISQHFSMHEIIKSQTATRLEIDNTLPVGLIPVVTATCENIHEPVRSHFGVPYTFSSFYRCYELEKVICKKSIENFLEKYPDKTVEDYLVKKSHPKGDATDFEVPGVSNIDLYNWIKDNLVFDQLILEFHKSGDPHSGWVHCSYNLTHNRNQAFEIG